MIQGACEQDQTPIFSRLAATTEVRDASEPANTEPMTPTANLYQSQAALDQVAQAESDLYHHLTVTPSGLCVDCAEPEPCHARYDALGILDRYGVLPRRRAGVAGVTTATAAQTFAGFASPQTRSNDAM